jgi:outer membrane protein OmpA-like peptidoglycan-associated protein
MLDKFMRKSVEEDDSHWISVGDLMSGLMMVFLFISVALMLDVSKEKKKIEQVAVAYQENQVAIYESLQKEFTKDLTKWNADIEQETLTFTFKSPEVLFKTGEIDLSIAYQQLLKEFFPRYMAVLKPFQPSINEVRIEGHTSSLWNTSSTEKDSYFKNMDLSQGRTRSVLEHIYNLDTSTNYRPWIKLHIAAVGLSSSKPIMDARGKEDAQKSRRVSFRVITNSDIQIKNIIETVK